MTAQVSIEAPVRAYMTAGVASVRPTDSLERAYAAMSDRGVSCLAVTEEQMLRGLISRTDMLRVGTREAGTSPRRALILPDRSVASEMTPRPRTVRPDSSVSEAARIMREAFIHRVFVTTTGGELVGVLSTLDLLRAIEERRPANPVGDFMTSPVFTIRDEELLGEAVKRLARGHMSGLVVTEDEWPVGIFGQAEALDARDLPPSVAVGDVMSPRVLVLPSTTSLHRAAAQASALGVRRVVIQDGDELKGILSGLDFAAAVG